MSGSSESLRWEMIGQRPGPSRWIKVVTNTYRMPDGAEVDWDIMTTADAVAVVALTEHERVILARQFPAGTGPHSRRAPGGRAERRRDAPSRGDPRAVGRDRLRRGVDGPRAHLAGRERHPSQVGRARNELPEGRATSPRPFRGVLRDDHCLTHRAPPPTAVRATDGRLGGLRRSRPPGIDRFCGLLRSD